MDIPLIEIVQYLNLGGLISLVLVGIRMYNSMKTKIIEDTEFKNIVENNKKEIDKLHDRITILKKDHEIRMREIVQRVDNDKDAIIKKFEEMDNKFEARFNKLTELIIDLFKK